MPEGVGYGPQFTTAIGRTLNYIGKYVYAYSGITDLVGASTETQLEFITGKQIIIGEYAFGVDANDIDSNAYIGFLIYLNGILMYQRSARAASSGNWSIFDPLTLVIPPLTTVKVEAETTDSGGTTHTYGTFTGSVSK